MVGAGFDPQGGAHDLPQGLTVLSLSAPVASFAWTFMVLLCYILLLLTLPSVSAARVRPTEG